MLDAKCVREDTKNIRHKLQLRGYDCEQFDAYVRADDDWRKALQEVDMLKNKRNTLTPKQKPTPEQQQALKELSLTIKNAQEALIPLEETVKALALQIPNAPYDDVPEGKDEEDNVVVREEGQVPSFDFVPKSHDVLGVEGGLMDFDTATALVGSRFVVMTGEGAKLERALINYMLDMHTGAHGYREILPPFMVHGKALQGTGQLPKFADDLFHLSDSEYWLSPTAEVQLTNLYQDKVISESELPLNLTAYTPCFRKEAGSYGKDIKGLIRLHQFNKVELVQLVKPEDSMACLQALLSHAETILQALELPYRVVELCTGDLGFSAAKTYDLEVWFPSQNKYREISSCSNFLDFQSRRAMIRYKNNATGSISYVHTLNGSALAVGRTLAAVLEHYQQLDGSILVPKVLQKYLEIDRLCQKTKS